MACICRVISINSEINCHTSGKLKGVSEEVIQDDQEGQIANLRGLEKFNSSCHACRVGGWVFQIFRDVACSRAGRPHVTYVTIYFVIVTNTRQCGCQSGFILRLLSSSTLRNGSFK